MLNIILSLVLGAGLDSLYYYLYISKIKGIKNKRVLLYSLIFIGYVVLFMVLRYNLYLYLIFYIYIYLILKFIYKSQINDFFLLIFIDIYCIGTSAIAYFLIPNYFIALIISKIIIFIPLLFINKIKKMYCLYCKMWNRNYNNKMPIKSLTLRNISLVLFNSFILMTYLFLLHLTCK